MSRQTRNVNACGLVWNGNRGGRRKKFGDACEIDQALNAGRVRSALRQGRRHGTVVYCRCRAWESGPVGTSHSWTLRVPVEILAAVRCSSWEAGVANRPHVWKLRWTLDRGGRCHRRRVGRLPRRNFAADLVPKNARLLCSRAGWDVTWFLFGTRARARKFTTLVFCFCHPDPDLVVKALRHNMTNC